MDNGPARKVCNAQRLQAHSHMVADPHEISWLRREDFTSYKGVAEDDNVVQWGRKPARGHQGGAAFLIMASGLDKHGTNSGKPLKFSHLDNAASAGFHPKPATGSPVVALAKTYLL